MTRDRPRSFDGPSIARVLLGGFVSWQLIFMLASTADFLLTGGIMPLDELVEDEAGRAIPIGPTRGKTVFALSREWSKLTLQRQYWKLFSDPSTRSVFPAVTLRWDARAPAPYTNTAIELRTMFEPEASRRFVGERLGVRLFNYDAHLAVLHVPWDPQGVRDAQGESFLRREVRVRLRWRAVYAYMRWRLGQFQREHPAGPQPSEVILTFRVFDTPAPITRPRERGGPIELPVARWRLRRPSQGYLPIEAYDPETSAFVPLKSAR